jgi:CRAL/TRIO domain
VWGFFKLITPFIDPLTREKLKFNEDTKIYVPAEQLWTENGGQVNFEYDHSVYWPTLSKICAEKRAAIKERWEKAGKRYGESELYLKGGEMPSNSATAIPSVPVSDSTEKAPAHEEEKKHFEDALVPSAVPASDKTEINPVA